MSDPTAKNARLAAARDLLRLLVDRKQDDAAATIDKAILNSSIGLIEEVIGPATSDIVDQHDPTKAKANEQFTNDTLRAILTQLSFSTGGTGVVPDDQGTFGNMPFAFHSPARDHMCKYWQIGLCQRGERCIYKHGE